MDRNKVCMRGGISSLGIAVVFAALAVLMLAGGAGALSNDGGGSWQYYRDIYINNTGTALTDYQIMVNLTGADFPTGANASGADVRFEKGGAELAYWIEEWDYANRSARVWVNVTNLHVGVSSMRMWYGNPNAMSSGNGNATFEFFDDFEGTNLDFSKWDINIGSSYTVSDGTIKILNQSGWFFGIPSIYSKSSFNDYIVNARVSQDTEQSLGDINYWLIDSTHYYAIQHDTRTYGGDNDFVFNDGGSNGFIADYRYKWNANEWILYTLNVHLDVLDFERISKTDSTRKVAGNNIGNPRNFATTGRKIGLSGDAANPGNFIVDWIFVRKFASPEPTILAGPVAEYHFDGNASDSSGNSNNGTIYGATFVQGVSGQALSFDGVDDYVTCGNGSSLNFGTGYFSLSAWIKTTAMGNADNEIVIYFSGSNGYYYFGIHPGNPNPNGASFIINNGPTQDASYGTTNLFDGKWHNIVFTRDTTSLKVFTDGIQEGSQPSRGLDVGTGTTTISSKEGSWFNGTIDEVRIYNRALSDDEIKAQYDEVVGAPAVTITSPAPDSYIALSAPVVFGAEVIWGKAPYSFEWTSNIDGVIGRNNNFTYVDFSPGKHKITLTVTDSNGIKGQNSVNMTISSGEVIPLFPDEPEIEVGGTFIRWYRTIPYSTIYINSNYLDYTQPDSEGIFNVSVNTTRLGITTPQNLDVKTYSGRLTKNSKTVSIDPSIFNFTLNILPRNYSTSWFLGDSLGGGGGIVAYVKGERAIDFKMTNKNQDTILSMNRDKSDTLTGGSAIPVIAKNVCS